MSAIVAEVMASLSLAVVVMFVYALLVIASNDDDQNKRG